MVHNHKELFIVEGQSAASTLEQAANPQQHHILALQGKLINAEKASVRKIMANEICLKLLDTLRCGVRTDCKPDQLAFSRIIILSDPDMDGTHSRLLLLMFFKHYLSALLEAGLVSVIIPPLYRITLSGVETPQYAWSDADRLQVIENSQTQYPEIMRLKGVAQFNRSECERLFLKPESRQLFRVELIEHKLQLAVENIHAWTL